jgi:hypothetical protein
LVKLLWAAHLASTLELNNKPVKYVFFDFSNGDRVGEAQQTNFYSFSMQVSLAVIARLFTGLSHEHARVACTSHAFSDLTHNAADDSINYNYDTSVLAGDWSVLVTLALNLTKKFDTREKIFLVSFYTSTKSTICPQLVENILSNTLARLCCLLLALRSYFYR